MAQVFQFKDGKVTRLSALLSPEDWPGPGAFGQSVAFLGRTLLIAAPEADPDGKANGAVAVYTPSEDGSSYLPQGFLPLAENFANLQGARFGAALVSAGEVVAVGAPAARVRIRHGQNSLGAVLLYKVINSQFELLQQITPNTAIGSNSFGTTIAMDNRHLLVGAPEAEMLNVNRPGRINQAQGAVHLYRKRGELNDWMFRKMLTAEPGKSGQRFGSALAIHGDQILASAPGAAGDPSAPAEALYGFFKPNEVSDIWRQIPLPQFPPEPELRELGDSVLILGDTFYSTALRPDGQAGILLSTAPEPATSRERASRQ
jgi:hypothetical protein